MSETARSYITIGRIVAPRGIQGELKLELQATDPARFCALQRVYLGPQRESFNVRGARVHQGQGLLLLEGIVDRTAAETWRDALVFVAAEDAPALSANEYLVDDILGLSVVSTTGEALGEVSEVIVAPANDVYVVRGAQGELLLPAIASVIVSIDLSARRMTAKLLDGLR